MDSVDREMIMFCAIGLAAAVCFGAVAISCDRQADAECEAKRCATGSPRRIQTGSTLLPGAKGSLTTLPDYECLCIEVPR